MKELLRFNGNLFLQPDTQLPIGKEVHVTVTTPEGGQVGEGFATVVAITYSVRDEKQLVRTHTAKLS